LERVAELSLYAKRVRDSGRSDLIKGAVINPGLSLNWSSLLSSQTGGFGFVPALRRETVAFFPFPILNPSFDFPFLFVLLYVLLDVLTIGHNSCIQRHCSKHVD